MGSELEKLTVGTEKLAFAYDAGGTPLTVIWNGTYYFYLTNLQGDVIAITDETGAVVVTYTYDAWGKLLSTTGTLATTLGAMNPLRYRGYVYDQETDLYYLQSRYYNPQIGRFINADNVNFLGADGSPLSYNLFVYCSNNAVMFDDPSGYIRTYNVNVADTGGSSGWTLKAYGAATKYTGSKAGKYNCYAYALGEKEEKFICWGLADAFCREYGYDVNVVAMFLLLEAFLTGRSIRIISSYNAPINENEYRIALRVGPDDYHLMRQHNDGTWSHKPGNLVATKHIKEMNPSLFSWDSYYNGLDYMHANGELAISNYYNSPTIYFAVVIGE